MALFVDGPVITVDTLTEHDSNVLAVSAAEGINLFTKILIAHDLLYSELERLIRASSSRNVWCSAAVDGVAWTRELTIWQVYESLALIYQDAYYTQLNDRHRARAQQYGVLANRARLGLIERGLGIVTRPLRRPPQPTVNVLPAAETGGTFYVCATYSDGFGFESAPSVVLSIEIVEGNAADLAVGPMVVQNAVGWNLYAGTSPDQMMRQNDFPIGLGMDWFYLPSIPPASGQTPPAGQVPDQILPLNRVLQRG